MNSKEIRRKLKADINSQNQLLLKRKALLQRSTAKRNQMQYIFQQLKEELEKLSPGKFTNHFKEPTKETPDEEPPEDPQPEFISIENAFCKFHLGHEINEIKSQTALLKKNISQMLRLLNEPDEEVEEYSDEELDEFMENAGKFSVNLPERKLEFDIPIVESDEDNPVVEQVTEEPIIKEIKVYSKPKPYNEELIQKSKNWNYIPHNDQCRSPVAHPSGGIALQNEAQLKKLRSIAKEIVRDIGKKILSGNFNLTKVSFPIKCMQPNTVLHNTIKSAMLYPLYLNKAATVSDPLERLKLIVVGSVSSYIHTSTFLKPINPILGETVHGYFEDGTEIWGEQSSHHPPISHFYIEGPYNSYTCTGYYGFNAKAGFNSVTITNYGNKVFKFPDGQLVKHTCPEEVFSGTFFGACRHETLGKMNFVDETNGIKCDLQCGGKKPSDSVSGVITDSQGKQLSVLTGSFLGYMEFDGVRYWDYRYVDPYKVNFDIALPSDSEARMDLILLREGNIEEAQKKKEELENIQRRDRKLREDYSKSA